MFDFTTHVIESIEYESARCEPNAAAQRRSAKQSSGAAEAGVVDEATRSKMKRFYKGAARVLARFHSIQGVVDAYAPQQEQIQAAGRPLLPIVPELSHLHDVEFDPPTSVLDEFTA